MAYEPADVYQQILIANLQRVIDFLKFAEAKNAALLALASAWLVASINLECSGKAIPGFFALSVPLAMLCALIAALLAMMSFLPRLNLPWFLGGKRAGPHPRNLLYFGDISALSVKSLAEEMHTRYYPTTEGHREEHINDLIVQISVNSTITMRKMRLFLWGMRLIALAGICLLLPILQSLGGGLKGLW
jgi:hypothetical protein